MAKDCANIFTPKATACFRQGETDGKAVLSPGQLAEGIVRMGLLSPGQQGGFKSGAAAAARRRAGAAFPAHRGRGRLPCIGAKGNNRHRRFRAGGFAV